MPIRRLRSDACHEPMSLTRSAESETLGEYPDEENLEGALFAAAMYGSDYAGWDGAGM